jgi:chorismate mutase/prephenate dehydratase
VKLKKIRDEVDRIDKKLVRLINRRTKLALTIGQEKKRKGVEVFAPDREKEVYENIHQENQGPLSRRAMESIYREIMSATLSLQQPLKIAYFGPPATFTHMAAIKKFGSQVTYLPVKNISDVFIEVETGRVNYGVVPVENSTEGVVTHTLDMFIESNLKICSEVLLEVSHNLLSRAGLSKIKKVYTNQQALAQCRHWLETNLPRAELIEVSSTARAAELAGSSRNSGAIASLLAASIYHLKIINRHIEDIRGNVTRFLVIGPTSSRPTGRDRTSIMFSISDRVGALYSMLSPFKKYRINLTKIESRPSRLKPWDYFFFIDLEGHGEDKRVKKALTELEDHCHTLKILGSYPWVK